MNFRWFIPILIIPISLSCDSDDYPYSEIPSVVLNKFRSAYPKVYQMNWKESNDNYEVEFEEGSSDVQLLISSSGNILRSKRDISFEEFPETLQAVLAQKFNRKNIRDPEIVRDGKTRYYQVEIRGFLFDKELVFDQDGILQENSSFWD